MPPYKVKLKAQKTLCSGTTAFYFEKPTEFEFQAGQFFNFTLLSPGETDLEGNTRALSIASAPHEQNLMVAMRLRSTAFKRSLNSLPPGAELLLQGPYGWMTLPRHTTRPAVLLAGGIGITPFRSLVWSEAESLSARRILLFYSVRVPRKQRSWKNCRNWSGTTAATNSSVRLQNPKKRRRLGRVKPVEYRCRCCPNGFRI